MATYVGKWDCPACGTQRIPGWADGRTVERCPGCGFPCTKKWYLDTRDMVLADPKEIAKARQKRAWTCAHCNHLNDAEDSECDACGNPRGADTDDKQVIARDYEAFRQPTNTGEVDGVPEESVRDNPSAPIQVPSPETARFRQRSRKFAWIGLGVVGVVALIILLLSLKKEVDVKVDAFAWERVIEIEDYAPRSHSSWNYPPQGAYGMSSQQEIHHYNHKFVGRDCHTESYSYACGTRDNGNGTFTDEYCNDTRDVCVDQYEDEPVYATKYYYTLDEWGFHHNAKASGRDKKPIWPSDPLVIGQSQKWREGERTGKYYLVVREKGGTIHQEPVDFKLWENTRQGAIVKAYKNPLFGFWKGLAKH